MADAVGNNYDLNFFSLATAAARGGHLCARRR